MGEQYADLPGACARYGQMGTVDAMNRSILIYANCQGERIASVSGAIWRAWRGGFISSGSRFTCLRTIIGRRNTVPDFMADVVLLWEQVETGDISRHRTALHQRLPEGCPVVKFPALSATCLWPFAGNDPRRAIDPDRYPWPDSIAATLATSKLPDDELFAAYLQHHDRKDARPGSAAAHGRCALEGVRCSVGRQNGRMGGAAFRSTNLFHTSGHIAAPAIGHLMKQVLSRSAVLGTTLGKAAILETDALLAGHTGQDFESVPIHPLVAERLDLRFFDPDATYRWHAHDWTFRQYILHYIRWSVYG